MKTFHLKIVTMDGKEFDGEAVQVLLRTIDGDVAIRARHIDYCSGIGMGEARVTAADESVRSAACIGGMISVLDGECLIAATTWEWQEEIDADRARLAMQKARKCLEQKNLTEKEHKIAQAKLKRALVRIHVAK